MPLPRDPVFLAFLLENYDKEARVRMAWGLKHLEQFQQAATFTGDPKNYSHTDIEYVRDVAGLPTTTRDFIASTRHRMTASMADHLLARTNSSKTEDPIMMPVDEETQKLLKESREEYLKRRNKISPEDKFYYPETGNWQYGWRLKDSLIEKRKPAHPRVMASTMFTKVGMQPDPYYYGDPKQLTVNVICP